MIYHLRNRRIALLGLGVENHALARFFQAHHIPFSVCDSRDLSTPLEGVSEWRLGDDYLEDLTDFDLLFRTPGIPALDPNIITACQHGVEVSSQTRIFLQLCPAPVLGITGTKGKGTTTVLTQTLLATDTSTRIFSGGNIGRPPIEFIDQLQPDDRVVLELSSFQLQDLDQSPELALILSITQDHLDYHADRAEYIAAKKTIVTHQTSDNILIVNQDCPIAQSFAAESPATIWTFSATTPVAQGAWIAAGQLWARRLGEQATAICPLTDIPLRGRHNWINAAAAVAASLAFGAEEAPFAAVIRSSKGLPHRLEHIAERDGIVYYNDSLATTVDAAIAAIESFDQPLLLIAGGASKNAEFSALSTAIARNNVRAALLIGQEAPRIAAALQQVGSGEIAHICQDLSSALATARRLAKIGDVVLLSPACASFGEFTSYEERGDRFRHLVTA